MNFMNLPKKYTSKDSKYCILPVEYEGNVSSGKGAKSGSKEIIRASTQLEYYDENFDNEAFENGIRLFKPLSFSKSKPETVMKKISETISRQKDRFILTLGGDHSVTIGSLKGMEKLHDDFSVIVFDAHPDLFGSWNGSKYNHRCVSKYASSNHDLTLIGIRSMDVDERNMIKDNKDIHVIYDFEDYKDKIFRILPLLKKKVYISIDVDVFDPSFIRNTGTPEPGGFLWKEFIEILKIIFEAKNVISADIVEFAPTENFRAEAYSLARLAYKIFSMNEFYPR